MTLGCGKWIFIHRWRRFRRWVCVLARSPPLDCETSLTCVHVVLWFGLPPFETVKQKSKVSYGKKTKPKPKKERRWLKMTRQTSQRRPNLRNSWNLWIFLKVLLLSTKGVTQSYSGSRLLESGVRMVSLSLAPDLACLIYLLFFPDFNLNPYHLPILFKIWHDWTSYLTQGLSMVRRGCYVTSPHQ